MLREVSMKIQEPIENKYGLICVRCGKVIDTSKMSHDDYFKLVTTRRQQRLHEECKIKFIPANGG